MRTLFTARRKPFLIAAIFAAGLSNALPASAQLPADAERAATGQASPGRIHEQFEGDMGVPQVSPQIEVKDLILQKVPEGAEDIHFSLSSLQLDGVTVYNADNLRPLYGSKLGTTISLADVYAIATALTNKYRNEGYILTQVIVPPQTIEGGVVQLRVVEGYVDNVTVQGDDQASALALIRTYAAKIRTDRALNVSDLERYLLLINDLPGVEARSILSPSRTQTGGADLRIIVTRDPLDAIISADNHGSRYLGPLQFSTAGSLNSFFGNNERITGQFVVAPDPHIGAELAYYSLSYEQPIWDKGTKIEAAYSNTDTEPGHDLDQFNVNGRSQLLSVKVTHPFIRSRSRNLSGRVAFDWRDVESQNDLEPTRHDRIRSIRLGGRYEFLDTRVGVGINSVDVEISKGLDILGSSDEGDVRLTRPFGDPNYIKINAELQRLQRLTQNLNFLVAVRGQLANDALLSSEEFGVGGINMGRGYDPSEIVGDDGVAGKLEFQWNAPYPWDLVQDYQLFGFFDAGRIWNKDATTSAQKVDSLTSAGFGVRTDFQDETEAGLAVAFPLSRDVQTQGDQDPRVYLNLSRRF